MQDFLANLLYIILTAAIPVIAAYASKLLNAKADEARQKINNELAEKYVGEAIEAAATATLVTAQTFVDGLKAAGTWTAATGKEALYESIKTAKSLLTVEAKTFLATAYGDLSKYLENLIEAEVKLNK